MHVARVWCLIPDGDARHWHLAAHHHLHLPPSSTLRCPSYITHARYLSTPSPLPPPFAICAASQSLGQSASTFFSIMNSGLHLYFPLPGLCWDALNCNDPEIQDDASLDDYNVADVVARTLYQAASQQENYVGDIYMTQGFDFNYGW